MTTKPPGYKAFANLTKILIQVPKKELDAQVGRYEAKKQRRKAKAKKSK
ncbi:MAG: hypothetical protein WD738_06920 [Pirellulales bacterium]